MINEDAFNKYLSDLDAILSEESCLKLQKARIVLDQNDSDSWDDAEKKYEEIRIDINDIDKICLHISETKRVVTRVKDHVFFREHIFIVDDIVEKKRFDPDPEIVNAWSRLTEGDHVESDVDLFKHEQVESILERRKGLDYVQAHTQAISLGYNWNPEEAYDGDSG